jgi:hypothetical protein
MAEANPAGPATQVQGGFSFNRLSRGAHWLERHTAVALGLSLPISVALDNGLLVLLLAAWLASDRWHEKYRLIRRNPVALSALALLAWIALGLAWGNGPLSDGLVYLRKYQPAAIAILVTVFLNAQDRRRALLAFAGGLAVTLIVVVRWRWGGCRRAVSSPAMLPIRPVFKKHHAEHPDRIRRAPVRRAGAGAGAAGRALGLGGTIGRCCVQCAVSVQGRTGYVVLAAIDRACSCSAHCAGRE